MSIIDSFLLGGREQVRGWCAFGSRKKMIGNKQQ